MKRDKRASGPDRWRVVTHHSTGGDLYEIEERFRFEVIDEQTGGAVLRYHGTDEGELSRSGGGGWTNFHYYGVRSVEISKDGKYALVEQADRSIDRVRLPPKHNTPGFVGPPGRKRAERRARRAKQAFEAELPEAVRAAKDRFPATYALIDDEDEEVRIAAGVLLIEYVQREPPEAKREVELDSDDPGVQVGALRELVKVDWWNVQQLVPRLLELVASLDADVAGLAATGVKRAFDLRPVELAAIALGLLTHPQLLLRKLGSRCLSGAPAGVDLTKAVTRLTTVVAEDGIGIGALGRAATRGFDIGAAVPHLVRFVRESPRWGGGVKQALEALYHALPRVKDSAPVIGALGFGLQLGDPGGFALHWLNQAQKNLGVDVAPAMDALRTAMVRGKHDSTRDYAVAMVTRQLVRSGAWFELNDLLSDTRSEVPRRVCYWLAEMDTDLRRVVPAIASHVDAEDHDLRDAATAALESIARRTPAAMSRVLEVLAGCSPGGATPELVARLRA
ncbi:MAG: hypothetical protein ACYS22_12160 [Planctomycetota bacterium]|jgi:hypothetical protein